MIFIPKWRIEVSTSRSGGPGGQHVNKTETKVELRFKLSGADWLPEPVQSRIRALYANRINKDDEFIVTCEVHRSQLRNQAEAFEILQGLIDKAEFPPKKRVKTKATRGSQRRRIEGKKARGDIKKNRGRVGRDD